MRRLIIRALLRLLSLLPMALAHALGVLIGWLFYRFPNRERRNARINLALCLPELSDAERERLLRRSLIENAKTLCETPAIWRGRRGYGAELIRDETGHAELAALLARGKGVIVAAPHLGSWEVGVHLLARVAPTIALYRPPRESALAAPMLAGRSRYGARLVPTDRSGIKALYQALERGELVAILPDQQPKPRGRAAGVFAPFFGVPALTMVLVGRLARKTGAAVIFSFAERLPGSAGYRAHWVEAPEGVDDPDPVQAAAALNLGVERCVRRCPEQYQWSYKRFHARPEGEPEVYRGPR
jgi:KDO2-lipid IV(A) lauroyltransferase